MAHPYTTRARMDLLIRPTRMVVLLDIDQDGLEDEGVFDDIIERAANGVDGDLARFYEVPFEATPSTPGLVSDLTDYASAVLLFQIGGAPSSEDAKNFLRRYEELLERIRSGTSTIPGATPVSADSGVIAAVFDAEDAQFAGVTDTGARRSAGLF